MEQKVNIEYGYNTIGNVTSWIFWLNDDRFTYSVLRLEINKVAKTVKFIEGYFEMLLRWKSTGLLFNILKIDWFYKAFPNPQYLLTYELFVSMVCGAVTNPITIAKQIIEENGLAEFITPRIFYRNVLRNSKIRFDEEISSICILIKVASNPIQTTIQMDQLLSRYKINEEFYQLVNMAYDLSEKVDLAWSNTRVEDELDYLENLSLGREDYGESTYTQSSYFASKMELSSTIRTIKINYTGYPLLPQYCSIISDSRKLHKEGKKMSHCVASYWHSVLHRESFIIHMEKPQKATFEIQRNKSGWFYIEEASGHSNKPVSERAMLIMNQCVGQLRNQLFFFKNSCFNMDKYGRRYHFLADPTLHDEVFEPEAFKYKMINSILT